MGSSGHPSRGRGTGVRHVALLTMALFWRLPPQHFPAFVTLMNRLQPSPVHGRNQKAIAFLANTSLTLTTCWGLFKAGYILKVP